MNRGLSLRQWVSGHPVIAAGAFGSIVFFLVGAIGCWVFLPNLIRWCRAVTWSTAPAQIVAGRIVSETSSRLVRPEFVYRYQWQGRTYTAKGYDLLEIYTTDLAGTKAALQAHPTGSSTTVLVNPDAPERAVLTRGDTRLLVLYGVPPLFAVIGLIGGVFTIAGWLGWLDPGSTHPFGRATRAVGAVLLRESVLKGVFFASIGAAILGLIGYGAVEGNGLLIGVGLFIGWGVWKAARPARSE